MRDPQEILSKTDHRPDPLPVGSWVMRQTWNHLLFAHWPVPPALLEPLLPRGLVLDTFDDHAYLTVLPFRMSGVRVRGLPPIPGATAMLQVNVRTYVKRAGRGGIYFLALYTDHLPTVWLTRIALGLPYHPARMSLTSRGTTLQATLEWTLQHHDTGSLDVACTPSPEVWHARPGSLEHWLTERYSMYTVHAGTLWRVDVHHHPWPLQQAQVQVHHQSLLRPLHQKLGLELPAAPALVQYARQMDALMWMPRR
ncbi:DUF2071 domain-containing protein [Alicyclobacillus cycloheptanicus]|uniref:Uncharacterized protein YqjF (DUF2071 family) n=1 Tax=Alicyclobacillus cycloheptanicus TaxID=1457 RepID=A0ABT9XFS8_9BACL|nr:DUF2071 domain-containing protein [Alicyclobacillus cycloheptanicus]MDQ0188596.1 uncharacterized protein YqjF (DUF2071 family) [Alicyclobacillus cycloheptanicus]WDM01274.1 DUF2071 domain-containing protein [Alicyclobacillus cycloheptanicus]